MANSRLNTLIDRFHNKTISDAEHEELLALLSQNEHAATARRFFRDVMESQGDNEEIFSEADSKAIYNSVQAKIEAMQPKPRVRILPVYKWAGVAAAACILIIAGYWVFKPAAQKEARPVAQTESITPDLLPGKKNKAILILADNKQIVLDSTGAGMLSVQGNASVRKDANGQIIYESGNTQNKPTEIVYNTLEIPNGGEYELVLSDGSKVWLNSASRIKFPVNFTGNTREVEINGEAYFEIAKDKARPFKVHFNSSTVEVLGTHFNVNAYDNEITQAVTLLEGSVKVRSAIGAASKGEQPAKNTVDEPAQSAILKPGEQAVLSRDHSPLTIHHSTDLEEAVAWKNGLFMFADEDLKSVMRKLARWYDFTPEYQGNIGEEQFGGMISKYRNISEVLKMFESTGSIHFKIIPGDSKGKGKKVIITK
ncbi:MAG TPA: FecR domain-containing protein [Niastella sp.]